MTNKNKKLNRTQRDLLLEIANSKVGFLLNTKNQHNVLSLVKRGFIKKLADNDYMNGGYVTTRKGTDFLMEQNQLGEENK